MLANPLTLSLWQALSASSFLPVGLSFVADGGLPSTFAVTDLASASMATAGLAAAELLRQAGHTPGALQVDRRLASFWFAWSLRPQGWSPPPLWDPVAGDYPTGDGWIRLHTNAPHHRAAAERVLGPVAGRAAMAARVATWSKGELERAVVDAGGCAAEMRSTDEWREHPQGRAVAAEPLIAIETCGAAAKPDWLLLADRPLQGVRVLDLTRVLAGPVASRFLAGLGAEVLRIDPPSWDEPGAIPEVCLGKRCARLDIKTAAGRERFEALLARADVLIHGYRADALERMGYDGESLQRLAPGLVEVCLNAYGWSGPWRNRRGFDSLVQMSSGIAEAGMRWRQADKPVPLPVQALDHATGYLMAAAALQGLARRLASGKGSRSRLSLARTAHGLLEQGTGLLLPALAEETPGDLVAEIELTSWGPARRLLPPLRLEGTPLRWDLPAAPLGSSPPYWADEPQSAGR